MWQVARVNAEKGKVEYPKCPWIMAWLWAFGLVSLLVCIAFILSRI